MFQPLSQYNLAKFTNILYGNWLVEGPNLSHTVVQQCNGNPEKKTVSTLGSSMIEEATHRQMWEIERWWWLFEVVPPPVAQQPQSMAELTEGKDL